MRWIIKQDVILSVVLSLTLAACSGPQQQVQVPTSTAVSELSNTPAPSSTFSPELVPVDVTPTPVVMPDMTETAIRAYAATADAVSTDVAAQGGGWPEVEGTLSALGLLQPQVAFLTATPTQLPFPVSTREVLVSWGTAIEYSFADPKDLLAARDAYEQYFDLISFQTEPPSDDIEGALVEYMLRDGSGIGPNSCLFADMLRGLLGKASRGEYIRMTPTDPLVWDDSRVFLDVGPAGIDVALGWSLNNLQVELVEVASGNVVKQKQMDIAGTAHLTYVADSSQWLLEDDEGGFYCQWIGFFE